MHIKDYTIGVKIKEIKTTVRKLFKIFIGRQSCKQFVIATFGYELKPSNCTYMKSILLTQILREALLCECSAHSCTADHVSLTF